MEEQVLEIMAGILKTDREALQASLDSRELWDSMLRIEVVLAMEEEFDLRFDEDQLAELDTPRKLLQAVLQAQE